MFLVRGEWPWRRLLRLKTGHRPAPPGFARRFALLQQALERSRDDTIAMPLAAWIDGRGRPCILTEFRQGLPLLERVRSGKLSREVAAHALRHLLERTVSLHQRELVHGSIVSGNVFLGLDGAGFLLDFGLAPILAARQGDAPSVDSDLAGFASLERSLGEIAGGTLRPSL